MNIVHIEDFIHPDAGYHLNLLSKLQVQQGHKVTIVTSELKKIPHFLTSFFGIDNIEEKDEIFFKLTGVNIIRIPLIGFYSGRAIFNIKIFKFVDLLRPDILYVHGNDTVIGMQYTWLFSKLSYPLVLDSHMLEMASKNKFKDLFRILYKKFISPIIIKNNIPLIRVVDSDYVEKYLGIPLNKTKLLSFGTDTSFFKPNVEVYINFRAVHQLNNDDFIVLYPGKLDAQKGGLFFAESIKDEICTESGRKVIFIIIGNTGGEYGKKVEETFLKSKNKIIRFPTQAYHNLASFYQAADAAIFPKQCSMAFFEVQSCGLPVILEENEINIERATYGNGCTFISNNKNDFRSKIINFADMGEKEYNIMKDNSRKNIVDNYNYVPIAQKFTDVLENEVFRYKNFIKN